MNEKNTAQTQKEEREEVLKEIRQLENRKKILENKQRYTLDLSADFPTISTHSLDHHIFKIYRSKNREHKTC